MIDRFSDLRMLLDVATLSSFSAAGRRHCISPAAVSARILRIEAEIGVKLFERTTRQLRLTEEGRLYIQFAQQALDTMEEAERAVHAERDTVRGILRISAPSDLGRNLLIDLLELFSERHPEVHIALTLTDLLSNLVLDELDVAIRVGPLLDSGLMARKLADSWRVVCASPSCISHHGMPTNIEELSTKPGLTLITNTGPQSNWLLGQERVRITRARESNDSDVIRKWAIQGHGFAYKTIWSIMNELHTGQLQLVMPTQWQTYAPLNALYHRNTFQPLRLRLLLSFLQEQFALRSPQLANFGLSPQASPTSHGMP